MALDRSGHHTHASFEEDELLPGLDNDLGTSIIQSLNAVSYYKVGQDDFTPSNDA